MVETVENSEEFTENSLQCIENSLQFTKNEELSEKRQRGRPKGSTDKVPRKRTVIREEPVTPVEVEPAPAVAAIAAIAASPPPVVAAIAAIPTVATVAVEPKKKRRTTIGTVAAIAPSEAVRMESRRLAHNIISERPPLSPRTLLRQAGETIYALQTQRDSARREYWAQQVAKSVR